MAIDLTSNPEKPSRDTTTYVSLPVRATGMSFGVRACRLSLKTINKVVQGLSTVHSGIWMGLLSHDAVKALDEAYYIEQRVYRTTAHNESGLTSWEKDAWERFFGRCETVVLAGAGGGRESLALGSLGVRVDAFECNAELVDWGNAFLQKRGCPGTIRLAPRDGCPPFKETYDGAIVGWGAYMLIKGRGARIAFLQELRRALPAGAPILLSFFTRLEGERGHYFAFRIASLVRTFGGFGAVEPGDSLVENYTHYFTESEILDELNAAGFELAFFASDGYGRAVGIAV